MLEALLEALGRRNPAQGADIQPFEIIERQLFILIDVSEIEGSVPALDDFGSTVVAPNSLDQFVISVAVALGDENVACPSKVLRWFTQSAARQQVLVAKGCLAIDQDDIQAVLEVKILQTIIEQQSIYAELFEGVQPGLHSILIHNNRYAPEIRGEHIRFIARRR